VPTPTSALEILVTASSDLPSTGDASRRVTLVALLAVAVGAWMIVVTARRRSTE
jgi:hypothetical protein